MQEYEKKMIKRIYKISQLSKNGTQNQRVEVGKIMTGKRKISKNELSKRRFNKKSF